LAQLRPGRDKKLGAKVFGKSQPIGEHAHRFEIGSHAQPPFEVADLAHAQTRPPGEVLLRQSGRETGMTNELCKVRRAAIRHLLTYLNDAKQMPTS
jgi:hypothetical protein